MVRQRSKDEEVKESEQVKEVGNDQVKEGEKSKEENEKFRLLYSPVHTDPEESPLSGKYSGLNYQGFFNLALLLLISSNVRLIVENYMKYGNLITWPFSDITSNDWYFSGFGHFSVLVCILNSYFIEKKLTAMKSRTLFIDVLCSLNCIMILLVPTIVTWYYIEHTIMGMTLLMNALITCMKLISYHSVNAELHSLYIKKVPCIPFYESRPYPSNVTLADIGFFSSVPSLCYQPVYPRTPKVRMHKVFKHLLQLCMSVLAIYFLLEQYAIPTVKNSMRSFDELDIFGVIERLLKLSISNLYIWLLLFFCFFHAYLNLWGEVTRFADRKFYQAWWNAQTLEEYWRLWNIPVHIWFKRHVYRPLRSHLGYSPFVSQIITFGISALLHEFLVGVPTHVIRFWAFFGMFSQIPMIHLTSVLKKRYPNSSIGNFVFWLTFCFIGQPACVLLYHRAWAVRKRMESLH